MVIMPDADVDKTTDALIGSLLDLQEKDVWQYRCWFVLENKLMKRLKENF